MPDCKPAVLSILSALTGPVLVTGIRYRITAMGGLRLNWWKHGIQLDFRIQPAGLVLALAYAITCWATRQISLDQFYLPAGVRVAALLACPPRLWPYLILGEYAYFAEMRYPLIDKYGLAWVVLGSATLMPAVALVVHLHRRVMAASSEAWLLSVAASAALVASALKLGLSHLLWEVPPSLPFWTSALRYLLGDYIAILTVAPLVLLWVQRHDGHDGARWRQLPTAAALGALLILLVLATTVGRADDTTRTTLYLLMTLPVIALTCMHGWRGAAVGVPLLNLSISATTPSTGLPGSFDQASFVTLQLIAVTGTALLALGSRITHHYHQYTDQAQDGRQIVAFSRTAHLANEMDLRDRALGLRNVAEDMEASLGETAALLQRHGHYGPAANLLRTARGHSRQFRELTSMVYPTGLEHTGLYVALLANGLRATWDATDRIGRPVLMGDPCQLSIGLQLAGYRVLVDAVALLLSQEQGQIRVRARCGRAGVHRGLLVSVALLDRDRRLSPQTRVLAIERLTAKALAYGGSMQCRHNRIRLLLLDAPAAPGPVPTQRHAAPKGQPTASR